MCKGDRFIGRTTVDVVDQRYDCLLCHLNPFMEIEPTISRFADLIFIHPSITTSCRTLGV